MSRFEQSLNLTIKTYPTNSRWTTTIEQDGNWVSIESSSGTATSTRVIVTKNETGKPRTATITVRFGKLSKTVSLTQGGPSSGIEIPEIRDSNWFIEHNYFSLEFDTAQRTAVWLAFVFNSEFNQSGGQRTNAWAYDPIIPRQYQWAHPNPTVQTIPGYDRGHIIASADRLFSELANKETFYISNISPQNANFNQRIWENLEGRVRGWARASDCDTMYVVKGVAINKQGTIYHVNGEPQVFGGVNIIGTIPNRNNVTVAKWWYMALVKRKGNEFTGIAWWFENKNYGDEWVVTDYRYAMSIRDLEHLTGINFFPGLKYALPGNPNLEEQVENNVNYSKWPL
jgi:endonuclease G